MTFIDAGVMGIERRSSFGEWVWNSRLFKPEFESSHNAPLIFGAARVARDVKCFLEDFVRSFHTQPP